MVRVISRRTATLTIESFSSPYEALGNDWMFAQTINTAVTNPMRLRHVFNNNSCFCDFGEIREADGYQVRRVCDAFAASSVPGITMPHLRLGSITPAISNNTLIPLFRVPGGVWALTIAHTITGFQMIPPSNPPAGAVEPRRPSQQGPLDDAVQVHGPGVALLFVGRDLILGPQVGPVRQRAVARHPTVPLLVGVALGLGPVDSGELDAVVQDLAGARVDPRQTQTSLFRFEDAKLS
ncbi:hypothetical protein PspLS_09286 [Pyricularia sp. CBS 133598]|nr:hypothetical protein PspLS_09286 [Pyricularia sp. CBS 133598]